MDIQLYHLFYLILCGIGGLFVFLAKILHGMMRMNTKMEKFLIEHEILMIEYCKRNNISVHDLPTRLRPSY